MKMKTVKLPKTFLALCLISCTANFLKGQTETVLYDGWANDYANGSNRTVFAAGLARPGTAGVDPYYRFVDGDAGAAGVQPFSATGGIAGVPSEYTGPTLFGGASWRDNVRPDDSSTFAGTILAVRENAFDVDDGSGTKGDPLRAYVVSDGGGITPDESFGSVLFEYMGGAGVTGLSWTGATNTDSVTATVRWVVVEESTVYVSDASFSVSDNGINMQTNTLADITSTTWAVWDPSSDIAALKFSETSPVFAAHTFTNVTKAGYLWELDDGGLANSNYIDMARFAATSETVAPVIISPLSAEGNVGIPFSYQIEATDSPVSYGVTGTLPDGLSVNSTTGEISGTPTTEEVQTVTISATNAQGTGTAQLEITIGPELFFPEITSPDTASGKVSQSFSYQITATNAPTSFDASNLPTGLSVDTATGLINGSVAETGQYSITVLAENAAGPGQLEVALTFTAATYDQLPGGRVYTCYFLGNSLTLSLSTAPEPELARLERLFAERGNRLEFGATLGAGVNLDQHWNGRLYDGQYMKQGIFDDQHEYSLDNGWADPLGADFGTTVFRDYNFALQGKKRLYDSTIVGGHTFDALVLQPYVAYLEADSYPSGYYAIPPLGTRAAIGNFIDYASGNNPSGHNAAKRYYIYSAWPQLIGIEYAGIDTDADGVYSFSEFHDQPYEPPVNPTIPENPREHVPSRDFLIQLHDAVRADNPDQSGQINLIPVGEVFAELDRLIRTGGLTGIETYFNRNAAYYLNARLNEQPTLGDAGFTYIYPPGDPASYGNDFIAAQGIKNIYADNIHWNNQTHNDPDSGTIGAYVASATIQAVITGDHPNKLGPETVARWYEAFDPVEDAALIAQIQQVIWQVVTSTDWHGVNYAERTGVGTPPAEAASYRDFKETYFSPSELADPAISGEMANPDGDAEPNIFEYYRLGNPLLPDAPLGLELDLGGGQTGVALEANSRPSGLTPALDLSNDLTTWERVDIFDAFAWSLSATAGLANMTAIVGNPGNPQFYRLALSYVPDRETLPMVTWGASADMVASNQNFANGLGTSVLDLSTPANPAVGAGYDTFSPVFFAAFAATSGNAAELLRINDNANPEDGTGDTMLLKLDTNSVVTENSGGFTAVWTQDGDGGDGGFLNGAETGDVMLANMKVQVKVGFGSGSASEMRFVIRKNGQFYISGDCGGVSSVKQTGANTSPYEVIQLPNPYMVDWYAYSPETDIVPIGAPVVIDTFDGITAVGFNWRTAGEQTLRYLYVEKFESSFYPEQN